MRRLAPSVALVLALATSSVAAQGVTYSRLTDRLDAKTRAAVVAIIDTARAASLPIEPLIDKALEGAAKRATGQQIVTAVHTYMVQLGQARSALGATSTELELTSGAQAIRAGIPVQQLERLRRARGPVQIATALTVASDLVAREVPVDTAVAVVTGLVESSATDEQLLAVRSEIEADILGGMPPALAATSRGSALEQTLAQSPPTNGAGNQGALPLPSGTSRTGDAGMPKPPGTAVGAKSPAGAPTKPPVIQRKRP